MKDIKVRIWDKVHNKWLGSFNLKELSQSDVFIDYGIRNLEIVEYTGLKDKNDKEIYEGDILKFKDYIGGILAYKNEVIEWMNTWEGDGQRMTGFVLPTRETNDVEAIGNIYENPELLK